tara:strand:+ start:158 stop:541 length:384 start_codon:yes stop_codon:yes gene_type:complete
MTDWAKVLKLADDEVDRLKEKKKPKSNGKQFKFPSGSVGGQSTGQAVPFNNDKFQQRKQEAFLRKRGKFESTKKDFGKATPEQIAARTKREERANAIEKRRWEKRHRGGYKKTAAYRAKMARANEQS